MEIAASDVTTSDIATCEIAAPPPLFSLVTAHLTPELTCVDGANGASRAKAAVFRPMQSDHFAATIRN
jgi:hypothetical protein